jgi:hypothetical protein
MAPEFGIRGTNSRGRVVTIRVAGTSHASGDMSAHDDAWWRALEKPSGLTKSEIVELGDQLGKPCVEIEQEH